MPTTLKDYCSIIGGSPSPILSIVSDIEDHIITNTEDEPDNSVSLDDSIGTRSTAELTLVERQNLRQSGYMKALIKLGKDKIGAMANYWESELENMAKDAQNAAETPQNTYNDIVNTTPSIIQNEIDYVTDITGEIEQIFDIL